MMMRTLSGESPISIGGTAIDSDDWYAVTNESGTVSTDGADDSNWNVHVTKDDTDETVTVKLKDATIANNSYSTHAIDVSGYDLEIVLEGTSNQIGTGTTNGNGYAVYNSTDGQDITISGTGDLTLTGYYGILNNGSGNVTVDINGSLNVQSQWQMISCGGQLNATAESITMDGYYIQCSGGVSLIAEDGDVNINGTGDYGINAYSDIMISTPKGAVSISGEKFSFYTSGSSQISVSAKNDISLTECVQGGDGNSSGISLTSQTGDITINSKKYQARQLLWYCNYRECAAEKWRRSIRYRRRIRLCAFGGYFYGLYRIRPYTAKPYHKRRKLLYRQRRCHDFRKSGYKRRKLIIYRR